MEPRVERRSDLLAVGVTDDDIQRRRRKGTLVSVRAGRYAASTDLAKMSATRRHLLAAKAAAADLPADAALSHLSAACLHGLPVWKHDLASVQVVRPGSGGGHRRDSLHTRYARLGPDDVELIDGIKVTSGARTIIDLGRSIPFERAVVCADFALRTGLVTPDQLTAAMERARRTLGAGRARQVVAFADGRSESVGESRSRVAMHRAGLPAPQLQVEIRSRYGVILGRSDFLWEEERTVGEFDGEVKYGALLRPGQDPGGAVFAEKRREDRIRDEGWRVVRWTWPELDAVGTAMERIRLALEAQSRRRTVS